MDNNTDMCRRYIKKLHELKISKNFNGEKGIRKQRREVVGIGIRRGRKGMKILRCIASRNNWNHGNPVYTQSEKCPTFTRKNKDLTTYLTRKYSVEADSKTRDL